GVDPKLLAAGAIEGVEVGHVHDQFAAGHDWRGAAAVASDLLRVDVRNPLRLFSLGRSAGVIAFFQSTLPSARSRHSSSFGSEVTKTNFSVRIGDEKL